MNLVKTNSFQPTQAECELLSQSATGVRFSRLGLAEWLEHPEVAHYLFAEIPADVIEDQLARALTIVQRIIEQEHRNLFLLDGHGRIVFLILAGLIHSAGSSLSEFRIYVFDMDPIVHKWHCIFFPICNVTSIQYDILKGAMEHRLSRALVYLNFCSVSAQVEEVQRFMQTWPYDYFISFTLEGNGKRWKYRHLYSSSSSGVMRLVALIENLKRNGLASEVSRRVWHPNAKKTTPFFVTFEVTA